MANRAELQQVILNIVVNAAILLSGARTLPVD
jgi:nitrogen-specific signal transduction histidine kinase